MSIARKTRFFVEDGFVKSALQIFGAPASEKVLPSNYHANLAHNWEHAATDVRPIFIAKV